MTVAKQPDHLYIGEWVSHEKYGTGLIVDTEGEKITVSFNTAGNKRILSNFLTRGKPAVAANDNFPSALADIKKLHGGTIDGEILRDAIFDGIGRSVKIINGEPWFLTRGDAPFSKIPSVAAPAKLTFINPADWHGKPVPARQWYSEGLIPLRQVTILNGDGGVGKSLLALQIAAAGAMSLDTLDMEPWAGKTLYIGAEDEAEEFHRRLVDIASCHGKELDFLFMFRLLSLADTDALLAMPDRGGIMRPTPLLAKIIDYASEFRPRLIVLDTAADLFGGNEIDRPQVRQFIAMLRHVAIALDCAVMLLAHPSIQGMQSGTGSSGSTAWNNSVRSRLYLTRPEGKDADQDARVLKVMKANYSTTGGEIKLRWKDGAFVLDDGKPRPGSMLLAATAERIFKELLSMLNQQGRNVCHVPGTTYAPAVMAKLPEAEGTPKARLVDAMNSLLRAGDVKIVKHGSASRERQKLILASEDFGPQE